MKIELRQIPIRDVYNGYIDSADNGVMAYGGKLNVRPAYQREFIYKDKERDAVIDTIKKGFPLNVIYWAKNGDAYQMMDGQQRTISFCQYIHGDFSINYQYFHNLTVEEQKQILDYELMVYICDGSQKEKLDWFKIINIAGVELTQQELRNAIYTGQWLTEAKKYFSKRDCPAYKLYKDYLKGTAIRQDYLETAIEWIAMRDGIVSDDIIAQYMALHQHDINANALWLYIQSVISWVKAVFPHYRKEMCGIEWGLLYNQYGTKTDYDSVTMEQQISALMADDDVTNKKGIYAYLLDGKEKHLNIRAFTPTMKRTAYQKQAGVCPICGKHFEIDQMQADHITPWHAGGHTKDDNCQCLCKECNRRKSGK